MHGGTYFDVKFVYTNIFILMRHYKLLIYVNICIIMRLKSWTGSGDISSGRLHAADEILNIEASRFASPYTGRDICWFYSSEYTRFDLFLRPFFFRTFAIVQSLLRPGSVVTKYYLYVTERKLAEVHASLCMGIWIKTDDVALYRLPLFATPFSNSIFIHLYVQVLFIGHFFPGSNSRIRPE